MSTDISGEQMQAKIAAARRDAEGLKDKIKRKKDELADTSCKAPGKFRFMSQPGQELRFPNLSGRALADRVTSSALSRSKQYRCITSNRHEVT